MRTTRVPAAVRPGQLRAHDACLPRALAPHLLLSLRFRPAACCPALTLPDLCACAWRLSCLRDCRSIHGPQGNVRKSPRHRGPGGRLGLARRRALFPRRRVELRTLLALTAERFALRRQFVPGVVVPSVRDVLLGGGVQLRCGRQLRSHAHRGRRPVRLPPPPSPPSQTRMRCHPLPGLEAAV